MDTYFSSINDCSFWKTDLFCGENDMGSYENSVYPRIFSADFYRTGDGRTYVYFKENRHINSDMAVFVDNG